MKHLIVKQEEEQDCGASSLLSIIKYYGGYVPLELVKIDTLTTKEGTNFYNIKVAAEKYGFSATGIKSDKINNFHFPLIAQLKINDSYHFVSVYKKNNKIVYIDPGDGLIKEEDEFYKYYNGHILILKLVSNPIKIESSKKFENYIKEHLISNKLIIFILFLLSFIFTILSLVNVFILNIITNKLYYYLLLASLFKYIILIVKNLLSSRINITISKKTIKMYINFIFNLPFEYLQLKSSGDLINRYQDLNFVKEFYSFILNEIILSIFLIIMTYIMLLIINIKLFVLVMLLSLLYLYINYKINISNTRLIHNLSEKDNDKTKLMSEYLNKLKTIKANNVNYFTKKLYNVNHDYLDYEHSLYKKHLYLQVLNEIILDTLLILSLLYLIVNKYSISLIIIFINVYYYYLNNLSQIINLFNLYPYFKDARRRVVNIFDIPCIEDKRIINNKLNLKNINYKIGHNIIFDNLNMNLNNNITLIKGENGSGKSTLFDIIGGLALSNDGIVSSFDKVSYLTQNANLFNDTILNNIILDNEYNEERFKKVENVVDLKTIFKDKDIDYNKIILEQENISGGEKQKILLARSLYKDFDLLILDESFNQIDINSSKTIINNIKKEFKDKMILITDHSNKINIHNKLYLTAREE